MSELDARLEKLRNILLSDRFDRKKKVRVLGRVMELRQEPRVCALIREATKAPVNEHMLNYFVRVLGYLDDPGAIDDLAGYLVHPRKLVARNAVKAAVSHDPERAVEMVMKVVRTAPMKNLSEAVRVLSERCPREAGPAIEKLMGSRSRRDRLVAVMFLSHAADLDAATRLIDLLRVEVEPAIVELAIRALERQATQAHRPLIEALCADLRAKGERLRELAARLPAQAPERAVAPRSESRRLLPLPPPAGAPGAPSPSAAESRPELLLAPAARPRDLMPWQEKERKIKARRARKGEAVETPRERALQALLGGALVCGVGLVMYFVGAQNAQPPAAGAKRVVDVATSPLGKVNAKVKIVGKIAEVHADYNTMLVRAKDGTLASVSFKDSIATFSAGREVHIDGTIREIRAGGICVVDGITARLP